MANRSIRNPPAPEVLNHPPRPERPDAEHTAETKVQATTVGTFERAENKAGALIRLLKEGNEPHPLNGPVELQAILALIDPGDGSANGSRGGDGRDSEDDQGDLAAPVVIVEANVTPEPELTQEPEVAEVAPAPEPVAATPAPEPAPTPDPVAAEAPLAPAEAPQRFSPNQIILPVPFPKGFRPTKADRLVGRLIIAYAEFNRFLPLFERMCEQHPNPPILCLLALAASRALLKADQIRASLYRLCNQFADEGFATLKRRMEQEGGPPAGFIPNPLDPTTVVAHLVPLSTDPEQTQAQPALDYVHADSTPPLNIDQINAFETDLSYLIGLLTYIESTTAELDKLVDAEEPWTDTIAFQLREELLSFGVYANRLEKLIHAGAEVGKEEEANLLASRLQADARSAAAFQNIIFIGADRKPERWTVFAKTNDNRNLAFSLDGPNFVLLIGNVGWGKTHFTRLISEGAAIQVPGLSRLGLLPAIPVTFSSDWREGRANHDMLCGMYPNPHPEHHQFLWDHYRVETSNVAFRRAVLLCMPGMKKYYEQMYPHLVERGLMIIELRFHPTELGHHGIDIFNTRDPKNRTAGSQWLDAQIAGAGDNLSVPKLLAALKKARLNQSSRETLERRLGQLGDLTSQDEHLIDVLELGVPVFVILESRFLPAHLLLPLQVAVMHVFSRVLRSGKDPLRIFNLDELTKYLISAKVLEYLEAMAVEIRHRPVTFVLSAQRVTKMPPGLVGLATVIGVFNLLSPAEFKRLQELCGSFHGISFHEQIRRLLHGQLYITGQQATDPRVVQQAILGNLRPTFTNAGGKTVIAG